MIWNVAVNAFWPAEPGNFVFNYFDTRFMSRFGDTSNNSGFWIQFSVKISKRLKTYEWFILLVSFIENNIFSYLLAKYLCWNSNCYISEKILKNKENAYSGKIFCQLEATETWQGFALLLFLKEATLKVNSQKCLCWD